MKESISKTLIFLGLTITVVGIVLYILEDDDYEEVNQIKELIKQADNIIKKSK